MGWFCGLQSGRIYLTVNKFMKHIFKSFILLSILFACSSKPTVDESQASPSGMEEEEATPKGLELIQSNDCQTCHHINNKLVGPSYNAIANKYETTEENTTLLMSKVIDGGTGVWGTMPMNAHPTLSEEDAREMIQYILALDSPN